MIRFGIVGCGHIAAKHVEAIKNVHGAVLQALCDSDAERMRPWAEDGIAAYLQYRDMLQDPCVDVVIICTPSGLHADMAVQAAQAGKHVVVEKPLALTLLDAERVIAACSKHKVKLAVVHPNRYRPAIVQLKKMLDEGRFGKLSHASVKLRWNRNQDYYNQSPWRGTRAMDGGVLMNQGIHSMDLLAWLMGPAVKVRAMSATRLRNIEMEDVALAVVQFADGALGSVEVASTVYPNNLEEEIALFGEHGSAVIGGPTAHWIKYWNFASLDKQEALAFVEHTHLNPFGEPGHTHMIRDMVEAIRDDRDPHVSGEDGKRALQMVLDIYDASVNQRSSEEQLISL